MKKFFKKEPVFCISALAAAVSCFFVPPDRGYFAYIDWRTIALLYCLMVLVAGLGRAGLFTALAHALCKRTSTSRALAIVLVLLCFFSSMFITNDVALITFVPFAVTVLGLTGKLRLTTFVVVMQTVAANLGSMLTPVGNPQNIHLFSHYNMAPGEFFGATLPVCAISLPMIIIMCMLFKNEELRVDYGERPGMDIRLLAVCAVLFALSLAVVFRLTEWYVLLPVVLVVLLLVDRRLLLKADFMLLATFAFFYVFVGNIARIDTVRELLDSVIDGRELLLGAASSQVISNVPAAMLLSGFAEDGRALLLGVNIGGLGTPIASLASLISMKLYSRVPGSNGVHFMLSFLLINFLFLALLLVFACLFVV